MNILPFVLEGGYAYSLYFGVKLVAIEVEEVDDEFDEVLLVQFEVLLHVGDDE